jgi:hypothetical protein
VFNSLAKDGPPWNFTGFLNLKYKTFVCTFLYFINIGFFFSEQGVQKCEAIQKILTEERKLSVSFKSLILNHTYYTRNLHSMLPKSDPQTHKSTKEEEVFSAKTNFRTLKLFSRLRPSWELLINIILAS